MQRQDQADPASGCAWYRYAVTPQRTQLRNYLEAGHSIVMSCNHYQ
jgi:hypothetical protein